MGLTRDKLGKKRKIRLPSSLVAPAAPKAQRAKPQPSPVPEVEEALEQLRMEDLIGAGNASEEMSGREAEE